MLLFNNTTTRAKHTCGVHVISRAAENYPMAKWHVQKLLLPYDKQKKLVGGKLNMYETKRETLATMHA